MNTNLIRCGACDTAISLSGAETSCSCRKVRFSLSDRVFVQDGLVTDQLGEMQVRDRQAAGYLAHGKFPTQIATFDKWLDEIGKREAGSGGNSSVLRSDRIALDLGCGPGPYTRRLQEAGYQVVAVDISVQSLKINSNSCKLDALAPLFVQADLNNIEFVEDSVDLVVMADFLQHVGGRRERERLLQVAFGALKVRGSFYLSFFNLNAKNYIKGDVHGEFSNGMIRYERLTAKNVVAGFPGNISVDNIRPMNIAHGSLIDSVLAALPFARFFSRMIRIVGTKRPQINGPQ